MSGARSSQKSVEHSSARNMTLILFPQGILSGKHSTDRQVGRQAGRQTREQTDRQADGQPDRQTDGQTNTRSVERQPEWQMHVAEDL